MNQLLFFPLWEIRNKCHLHTRTESFLLLSLCRGEVWGRGLPWSVQSSSRDQCNFAYSLPWLKHEHKQEDPEPHMARRLLGSIQNWCWKQFLCFSIIGEFVGVTLKVLLCSWGLLRFLSELKTRDVHKILLGQIFFPPECCLSSPHSKSR